MALPALIVCLCFITYLLVRDHKRRPALSAALWLPTFFLLILGSRPLSLWLGGSRSWNISGLANDAERNSTDQLFFFFVLGAALIITAMRQVKWGKILAANIPLLMFYLYFAISIAWSEDPIGSTKRLVKDFGMLFVIAAIFSEKNPLDAVRAVYVRCACILFPLSAVFIKWFPEYARTFGADGQMMFTGVTTQKNTMGEIVLIFGLFMVWDCIETWPSKRGCARLPWDRLFLLAMGFWLLHMCQSKTALLCLLIGSALMLRSGRLASKTFSRIALAGALSLPYLLFFAQRFSSVIAPLLEALGRDATFTGRTDIWQHITATTVNPWIGDGYWNFWGGPAGMKVNEAMNALIPNAHNGYLDIYLDGGVIGLSVLFFLLVAYGRRLMKNLSANRLRRLRFAMLVVVIIYNLTESMYARVSPLWFTTLLVLVDLPFLSDRPKKKILMRSQSAEAGLAATGLPQWSDSNLVRGQ
jgi:exopolysaccharide production protein ExoQ